MDQSQWDELYASTELVWTAEANRFVVEELAGLAAYDLALLAYIHLPPDEFAGPAPGPDRRRRAGHDRLRGPGAAPVTALGRTR